MRYRSCRSPDTELRGQLHELADACQRFGYRRLFVLLRKLGEPSGAAGSTGRKVLPCASAGPAAAPSAQGWQSCSRGSGIQTPTRMHSSVHAYESLRTRKVCLASLERYYRFTHRITAIGAGPRGTRAVQLAPLSASNVGLSLNDPAAGMQVALTTISSVSHIAGFAALLSVDDRTTRN